MMQWAILPAWAAGAGNVTRDLKAFIFREVLCRGKLGTHG